MTPSRAPRRLAAVAVAAAVLVAGCGDDDTAALDAESPTTERVDPLDSGEATDTTDIDVTSTTAGSAAGAEDDPAAAVDADQVIEVTVTGGTVEGGGRHQVSLGDTVALVVASDAPDEIHVHGYDLTADVVAGEPAALTFAADIPGVFEVELHDAHLALVELEIR